MSANANETPDTNILPDWPEGHYSLANLKKRRKAFFARKIPEFKQRLTMEAFCDNRKRYVNYFSIGSMTFKELVDRCMNENKNKFKNDKKDIEEINDIANDIIIKAGDNALKPLNFATDIKTIVFPNGIKGTPPYKKPGFMGSARLRGDNDPSKTDDPPNWVDGYFSVAYLNAQYQGYVRDSKKPMGDNADEHMNKHFYTKYMAEKYNKDAYDGFISRLKNEELCGTLDFQLRDFGDTSCKENYERMKCSRIEEAILNKRIGETSPLDESHLPAYNNPNPNPKKQGFFGWGSGKRKQRRTKTNKFRTHNSNKRTKHSRKVKRTKKNNKNNRVKHSRKAKKARKSRNARKTRKH